MPLSLCDTNAICGGRVFSNHSLVYLRKNSELCRVEPQFRPPLPPIHPRFSAYSCAIEVRLMYVCCPFINRTTIGQQSNNNGRKSEGKAWVEWNRIGTQGDRHGVRLRVVYVNSCATGFVCARTLKWEKSLAVSWKSCIFALCMKQKDSFYMIN